MACGQLRTGRDFNPRSPRGGATSARSKSSASVRDFNPRSPRGGATLVTQGLGATMYISIHAPHEGERLEAEWEPWPSYRFQSTLPTRGSDARHPLPCRKAHQFQSTLPTRGSDCPLSSPWPRKSPHFNPRSPRGGATGASGYYGPRQSYFNPRSPRGGATQG